MTPYSDVYKRFLNKIESDDFIGLEDEESDELLLRWLNSALARIELECVKLDHDLIQKDDDLEEFESELSNAEIEIIALYMVVVWYEPKINSLEHTTMWIGSNSEKWTDQKKHLEAMQATKDNTMLEIKRLISRYHLTNNSYLRGH